MTRNTIARKALLCLAVACGLLSLRGHDTGPFPGDEACPSLGASVGGTTGPGGVQIQCDLPAELQKKNISSNGLGCCVFRSADHAGHWQNIPALYGFPEWMVANKISGGGYPSKLQSLTEKIAADRGLPVPLLVQVEGAKDPEFLKLAHKTGRMTLVTYSKSPSGRYANSRIAHMINLAHADGQGCAALDNNFVASDPSVGPEKTYEWMTWDEFFKISNPDGYWAAVYMDPPPPPPPVN